MNGSSYDVVIMKTHTCRTSPSLLREIDLMRKGSSPYVTQVLGVFKGRLPHSGPSTHIGLVMEIMERGSLACLQVQSHSCNITYIKKTPSTIRQCAPQNGNIQVKNCNHGMYLHFTSAQCATMAEMGALCCASCHTR